MTQPVEAIRVNVDDLTLGDLDYLERFTGTDPVELLRTRAGRRMMAIALHDLRTYPASEDSAQRRSWSEIASLRATDVYRSTSPSGPDGRPTPPTD